MEGKKKYTQEFRESAVKLVIDQGRRVEDAAANLGMPVNTLLAWVSKAEVPAGGVASKVTAEDMKKGLDPKGKK